MITDNLQRTVYPYLKKPLRDTKFVGKGIVLTTGEKHLEYSIHLILTLRKVIKSTLPIEILYNGAQDLNSTHVSLLKEFDQVKLIDIFILCWI